MCTSPGRPQAASSVSPLTSSASGPVRHRRLRRARSQRPGRAQRRLRSTAYRMADMETEHGGRDRGGWALSLRWQPNVGGQTHLVGSTTPRRCSTARCAGTGHASALLHRRRGRLRQRSLRRRAQTQAPAARCFPAAGRGDAATTVHPPVAAGLGNRVGHCAMTMALGWLVSTGSVRPTDAPVIQRAQCWGGLRRDSWWSHARMLQRQVRHPLLAMAWRRRSSTRPSLRRG